MIKIIIPVGSAAEIGTSIDPLAPVIHAPIKLMKTLNRLPPWAGPAPAPPLVYALKPRENRGVIAGKRGGYNNADLIALVATCNS